MNFIWQSFLDSPEYGLALLQAVLLSVIFPFAGFFLLIRKLTFWGDTISHAILPGVVIAMLFGLSGFSLMLFGAGPIIFIFLLILTFSKQQKIKINESEFVFLSIGTLALGVILAHVFDQDEEIIHLLLGDLLATDKTTIAISSIVALFTAIAFAIRKKDFLSFWIDSEDFLKRRPLSIFEHLIAMMFLVLVFILGFSAMGALLTSGLLIFPSLIAKYISRTPQKMLLNSILIGVSLSFLGLLVSAYWSWPPGASIVLIGLILFVLVRIKFFLENPNINNNL